MPVAFSCRTPAGVPWEPYVARAGRQVLRALALARCELSVSLVGDAEMRTLNRTYRRRDRPTDVLAFAFDDDTLPASAAARRLLGDVVISIETAAAQARVSRCRLAARVDALLIHGVLHLVGYDHEISPAEERRMARRAREVRRLLVAEPCPAPPAATGATAART